MMLEEVPAALKDKANSSTVFEWNCTCIVYSLHARDYELKVNVGETVDSSAPLHRTLACMTLNTQM